MTPLDQFIAAVTKDLLFHGWNLGDADNNGVPVENEGSLAAAIRQHAHLVTGITPDRSAELQREIAETQSRLATMQRELSEIGGAE